MPTLPIPFRPESPYSNQTNVVVPVLVRAARTGAILMIEWETLKFTEHAPFFLDVATVIIALLILSVIESRQWLNFKGRNYFLISIIALIFFYLGVVAYAYFGFELKNAEPHIASDRRAVRIPTRPIMVPDKELKLGPQKTLAISKYLGNQTVLSDNPHWAVFVTFSPENREFYSTLIALLRDRRDPWILDAPDNSTDLDAPKFPAPPDEPGIVLHGDNALNTALSQILGPCFVIRKTDREIEGLRDWFNKRLSEPERIENRKITWLEIGHGSPWRQGNRLSVDCLR